MESWVENYQEMSHGKFVNVVGRWHGKSMMLWYDTTMTCHYDMTIQANLALWCGKLMMMWQTDDVVVWWRVIITLQYKLTWHYDVASWDFSREMCWWWAIAEYERCFGGTIYVNNIVRIYTVDVQFCPGYCVYFLFLALGPFVSSFEFGPQTLSVFTLSSLWVI